MLKIKISRKNGKLLENEGISSKPAYNGGNFLDSKIVAVVDKGLLFKDTFYAFNMENKIVIALGR